MTRRQRPYRFKLRITLFSVWGFFLILVALAAFLLPGSPTLQAGWNDRPAVNGAADDWAMAETTGGGQPSLAPRQESAPAVTGAVNRGIYVVDDPNAYVHTVRLGEYWIGIARDFGIEYAELRAANPELWSLRKEVIRPGDQMVIPNLGADQMTEPIVYTVASGDSWYKIAEMFGVSYWDLRLDNLRLWQRRGIYIRPGDEMVLNGVQTVVTVDQSEARAEVETPAAEETQPPAETTETPAQTPAQPAPSAGTTLPPSSATDPVVAPEGPQGSSVYTVRPGDSWFSIAATYGIPFADLRAANPNLWATRGQSLRVGDQVVIPAHGSPPPPPEIRLVPVEPGEIPAGEEGAPEEEATEEAAPTEAAPVETPADEGADEGAEADDAELTPAQPAEVAPLDADPTAEAEEERVGPMQAETPEAGRLRIELAEPTIIYIVQAGDDWASIAAKTGATVEALQAANPAFGGRALQAGDQLRLP